jgi:hypothetical protein
MRHQDYQVASGGTIGRDHRIVPKNCQDDHWVVRIAEGTIGIVADGCGSGVHSEVGASIGVRLLGTSLITELQTTPDEPPRWQRVQQHVLSSLDVLARQLGGNYRQTVEEYFLFTLVGFVLTNQIATFFAFGDGMAIVNGRSYELGSFPGNAPPYVGYGLLGKAVDVDPAELQFKVVTQLDTSAVQHFLVGSDGVSDLMKAAERPLPGLDTPVGSIAQFWQQDRYFANPALVSRQLNLVARDWPRKEPRPGLLPDDTTLIVGRRPLGAEGA